MSKTDQIARLTAQNAVLSNKAAEYQNAYLKSRDQQQAFQDQLAAISNQLKDLTSELNLYKKENNELKVKINNYEEFNTDESQLAMDIGNQDSPSSDSPDESSNKINGTNKRRPGKSPEPPRGKKDKKEPLPPPIFITNVKQFGELRKQITLDGIKSVQFKAVSDNELKITCESEEEYRKLKALIKKLKENDQSPIGNIGYHTYQLKNERPFRFVIRGIPSSTDVDEIKRELTEMGHEVVSLVNIKKKSTKNGVKTTKFFPLFFVNLALKDNNKDVYAIRHLQQCMVKIEAPKRAATIPQCTNCQMLGHTKNFCDRRPRCVKCAKDHHYSTCNLQRTEAPTCVLCEKQGHPASYKGCEEYQKKLAAQKQKPKNIIQRVSERPHKKSSEKQPINQTAVKDTTINDMMAVLQKIQAEFQTKFSQLSERLDRMESKSKPAKKKTKKQRK